MSAKAARAAKARRHEAKPDTQTLARQILADIRAQVPPEKLRAFAAELTPARIPSLVLEIAAGVMKGIRK